jgi:predicted small integral membrane protein
MTFWESVQENTAWMAWTWPVAIFFIAIACGLLVMTVLAIRYPEVEKVGVLRIPTTRGDRFFVALLGSALIHVAWLALAPAELELWWASLICLVYAAAVFRWV